MAHVLDQWMKKREHEQTIWCPHCGGKYDDSEDHHYASMWGTNSNDDGPYEVECGWCCQTFWVTEWVDRTYHSSKKNEMVYSNEAKAEFREG